MCVCVCVLQEYSLDPQKTITYMPKSHTNCYTGCLRGCFEVLTHNCELSLETWSPNNHQELPAGKSSDQVVFTRGNYLLHLLLCNGSMS